MTSQISDDRLKIEYWPLEKLIPFARNARTHSPAQVAEIAGSIRTFGFANPILVGGEGDVIAGHGRLAAARQLGLIEVPVIVLANLSELQRRQLVLADNRIALNAGWDPDMLKLELADLKELGADLSLLGFDAKELAVAFGQATEGLTDENEIPKIEEVAVAAPGDVWCLGPHRIACGDSTDRSIVQKLLASASPQLMVTDPPYGVEYDPEWRHRIGVNKSARRGKVQNDERADWTEAWACWYAVKKKGNWTGDRKQTTLWEIPSGGQDAETKHSTQKPVECMRRPMLNNSNPGQAVYEPFLGSGTTLIAAQSAGRVCYGIEVDPHFVDVAIRRWQNFTGEKARREIDGQTFEDAERHVLPSAERSPSPTEPVAR